MNAQRLPDCQIGADWRAARSGKLVVPQRLRCGRLYFHIWLRRVHIVTHAGFRSAELNTGGASAELRVSKSARNLEVGCSVIAQ